MTELYYPRLEERLLRTKLANGLTVLVVPKPGFSRKIAYFVTDFGSIHTDFSLDGQEYHVPAGIAHYLEHKLFDMPGRDISQEFADLGGNPNAFTSYDMTAYYFSCTENFDRCLELLLEFVSTPYFTEESVEKERGIISQEIMMCDDASDNQVFENLTRGLYREHPVRIPILGTQESIRQITADHLYLCHRAFYAPGNMMLCVVGDVDPAEVVSTGERMLPTQAQERAVKLTPREQRLENVRDSITREMDIAMPTFQLGLKCLPNPQGEAGIRREIMADFAAEALFGESSPLYLQLYDEGYIDSSFGGGYETLDGAAMLLCGGDSDDPEATARAVLDRLQELAREGICDDDFRRMKKSALGRRIRDLGSFDSTCFRLCACHFTGFDYLEFPRLYESVTRQDVEAFLREIAATAGSCLSIINPRQQEDCL